MITLELLFLMDEAVLALYPLPKRVSDADLNRGQLAQAFGVSTNTVDKWRVDGMPVEQEGTNGTSYVFRLSHCWAWREARQAEDRAVKVAGDAAAHQLRMHFLNVSDDQPRAFLSPAQRIAEAEAEMKFNLVARARRELIHTAEVELLLAGILGEVRAGLQNFGDWAERELGLTPAQVMLVIDYTDEILNATANAIEAQHLLTESRANGSRNGELAL